MDASKALAELEALASKLDVDVVYDHLTGEGMGSGGLCKVKGHWRVIIERRGSESEKLAVLARALGRFDLEEHYISPSMRQMIDHHRKAPTKAQQL